MDDDAIKNARDLMIVTLGQAYAWLNNRRRDNGAAPYSRLFELLQPAAEELLAIAKSENMPSAHLYVVANLFLSQVRTLKYILDGFEKFGDDLSYEDLRDGPIYRATSRMEEIIDLLSDPMLDHAAQRDAQE